MRPNVNKLVMDRGSNTIASDHMDELKEKFVKVSEIFPYFLHFNTRADVEIRKILGSENFFNFFFIFDIYALKKYRVNFIFGKYLKKKSIRIRSNYFKMK